VQFGSSTHGALIQWAQKNDVPLEAVTIVSLHPLDMPSAMKTRQIDAMAGSEPWPTNVEELCGDRVHQLADSGGLGNTFPMLLIVKRETLEHRRRQVQNVLRGLRRGVAFINNHLDQSAELVSPFTGLAVDNQRNCLEKFLWDVGFDESDLQSLYMTGQALKDFGKIAHIPDFAEVIDLSLLEKKD
jgi:ABC-type nitrate/sulfonate/bicarbonate transport system substrate-binding protein